MEAPELTALMLLAALAGLLAQVARLARRWSRGRLAAVDWIAGLRGLPHAYFGTVHAVVARDERAARMHVLAAGGTVVALGASLLLALPGLGGAVAAALAAAGAAAALVGAALAAARRWPSPPARLSGGGFALLPVALAGLAVFLGGSAAQALTAPFPAPAAIPLAAIGAASLAWLVFRCAAGPMRHALAGIVHLVAHPRPARFHDPHDTALAPLDLAADTLGAGTGRDFAWNRLAGFDACVQCGRCEAACPAFAAGQPLNPKKLVNDLVLAQGSAIGRDYAGSPHPGVPVQASVAAGPLVGEGGTAAIRPGTLWACTTCRACVQECPMLIEHVDAVIDLRRFQTLALGAVPGKVAAALTIIRETDTPSGRRLTERLDFAADLALPILAERGSCDVLLWLGEAAFEPRGQRSLRALVRLLRRAGVDFAVLAEERDTGDLARRLGDEATFQDLARANIATLGRYRFETILTADPHVLHALGREYPAFGGSYRVVHHTTFLEQLAATGRLPLAARAGGEAITYHDPCYLGRYAGEFAAPRRLIERTGATLVEMERSGPRSSCCGGGGGAPLADIPGARRIPDIRMEHVRATGAGRVAVACPSCAQMLEGVTGPRPEVIDVAELVLAAAEGE